MQSLQEELDRADYSDSLIVLPEAFNVPGGYLCGRSPDVTINRKLHALSAEKKVVFVAGLIEPRSELVLGCNSAYLIDDDYCLLLSRKVKTARYGLYRSCSFYKPVLYRGLGIAVLICNDSDCDTDRRTTVIESIVALSADAGVLCIPACLTSNCLDGYVSLWRQVPNMVLASGDCRMPSMIRVGDDPTATAPEDLNRNNIRTRPLILSTQPPKSLTR